MRVLAKSDNVYWGMSKYLFLVECSWLSTSVLQAFDFFGIYPALQPPASPQKKPTDSAKEGPTSLPYYWDKASFNRARHPQPHLPPSPWRGESGTLFQVHGERSQPRFVGSRVRTRNEEPEMTGENQIGNQNSETFLQSCFFLCFAWYCFGTSK